MKTEILTLSGMHCGHCVRAVEEVLTATEGIRKYSVVIGSAEIHVDEDWAGIQDLTAELDREGYQVGEVETISKN
jgi:copper chaperone